jgi:ribosome-binding factor A
MEGKRQQQVAKLIQKDLSEIFQRDAKHLFGNDFITITSLRITPDLSIVRAYLSFLKAKNKAEALADIQEHTKTIRQLLGQKIKNSVRIVPQLHFYLDDTAEYVAHIEGLLDSLNIPPAEDDEEEIIE